MDEEQPSSSVTEIIKASSDSEVPEPTVNKAAGSVRTEIYTNVKATYPDQEDPPDGGARAWLVMISSFLCLGLIFGLINSYSIIYSYLQRIYANWDDSEASSKAALIGSVTFGTTLICSPIAGILADRIGMPFTTLIGGTISVLGLFLSSLAPWNATVLLFSYGFLLGFGLSLVYTPTLSILGIYFKRYLGKVNGFVSAGASIFTIIMPPALSYLLTEYNLGIALKVLALCFCFLIVAAFVYRPMRCPTPSEIEGRQNSTLKVDIWKNRPYVIWTLSCALALFGYYISYVHMAKFVEVNFPGRNVNFPIMSIGVASCVGRLIVGIVADTPGFNKIRLHQWSLIGIGVMTLLLPAVESYSMLLFCTVIIGIFDGMFFPVLGPICYQLCGAEGATQAIGFFLGLVAVPLTIGPVLAGKIFDETRSYTLSFVLAGISSILGAFCMGFIRNEPKSDLIVSESVQAAPAPTSNLLNEKTISVVIESSRELKNQESNEDVVKRRYRYSIL